MAPEDEVDELSRSAPPRLWTVAEANARLGELNELLPALRLWVQRLRAVHTELHRLVQFWGAEIDSADLPDRRHKDRLDQEWIDLTRRIEEAVSHLRSDGIEIKDLDQGLVDFYARLLGEIVFLCWRSGEDRVAFYHRMEGGFRTRQPIPDSSRSRSA